jgi:uncharacterized surface protein with fasciclin (FAS1) repeats
MKKILFIALCMLNTCILFAQVPVTTNNTDTTSAKKGKLNSSTLKKTDGKTMLPANDITTNISRAKELSAFFKAIQLAQLNETFSGLGPITVFAPSNQAFTNLPPGKLDTLLSPEHKYDLIALVTYHAIAGKITSRDIARQVNSHNGTATFIMLNGSKLTAKIDENRNLILIDENGGQSIISRFDIQQNNGLIHIVNSVLVPKFKNI